MRKLNSKVIGLTILISSNQGLAAEAPQIESNVPESQCQMTPTKDEKIAEATALLQELNKTATLEEMNKKIEVVRQILEALKVCGEKELNGVHPTCD